MAGERGLIIAIDGPASSGKSTTARLLAERLGYLYIDTGAMYRAATLKVLREGIDPHDPEAVSRVIESCEISLESLEGGLRVLLDGEDVSDEIRTPEVTLYASAVSEVPHVREILVDAQRAVGARGGVVLEGRDIGTVVFPHADLKIYLEADLRTRADRRRKELQARGTEATVDEVAEDVRRRDAHDSSRERSPLRQAVDAHFIDTSNLTIEEQVDEVEVLARERMANVQGGPKPMPDDVTETSSPTEDSAAVESSMVASEEELEALEYTEEEYEAMMALYDETLAQIDEGQIVTGVVISIEERDVIVDVGFKSEGAIPIEEFGGPEAVSIDDKVDVYLENIENQDGQIVLSKSKADFMKVWHKIKDAYDTGEVVIGRPSRRIKGGLMVDLMGVSAFLPGSQVALRQVRDFDQFIDRGIRLKIIKINKNRRNIVVSRRMVLEEERAQMRKEVLTNLVKNQIREGTVKNITDFGAFIDLGGVDGLLHITDMSWGRISHPSEIVNIGEVVQVKVLDFNEVKDRISLGLKQLQPYPWRGVVERYPVNAKVMGKVVSITDYGAFVELEEGIEGLVHISEMSWTQHIRHPSKLVNIGDEIEVVVLRVNAEEEKVSLGLKQTEPDPWETLDVRFPVGTKLAGKVRNLTNFGAFVEIEPGIDGLVHISDLSWTKRIRHPSEMLSKSDEIEVVVLSIDREQRRISLGHKQAVPNPWDDLVEQFKPGTETTGTITRLIDKGVIVDLPGDVEGLVPLQHLGREDLTTAQEAFDEGDELPLTVIEFDREGRKIVLSVTEYFKSKDKKEQEAFLKKHEKREITVADHSGAEELAELKEHLEEEQVAEPVEEVVEAEVPAEKFEEKSEEKPEEEPEEKAEQPPEEVAAAEKVEAAEEPPAQLEKEEKEEPEEKEKEAVKAAAKAEKAAKTTKKPKTVKKQTKKTAAAKKTKKKTTKKAGKPAEKTGKTDKPEAKTAEKKAPTAKKRRTKKTTKA